MNEAEQNAMNELVAAQKAMARAAEAEANLLEEREIQPRWSMGGRASAGVDEGRGQFPLVAVATGDYSGSFGSENMEIREQMRAAEHRTDAAVHDSDGDMLATAAAYEQREKEWSMQREVALAEIAALEQQKTVSDIRVEIARKDLETHLAQQRHSREIYEFAKDRFTGL